MNLNATIIRDDIGDLCVSSSIVTSCTLTEIRFADLYEQGMSPDRSSITIIPGSALVQLEPCHRRAFIVLGDLPQDAPEWIFENDLLFAQADATPAQLLRAVQECFARYDSWQETMRDIVARNGSIDELVAASLAVFKCNIMLHDNSYRVISYMLYGDNQDFNAFSMVSKGGFLSRQQLTLIQDGFKTNAGMRNPFKVQGPHINKWIDGPNDLSLNVQLPDDYVVRINLGTSDGTSDVPPKLMPLIERLGLFVRYIYLLYPPDIADSRYSRLADCMSRLYDDQKISAYELEQAAKELGWNYRNDLYLTCLVIPLDDHNGRASLTRQPLLSIANRVSAISDAMIPLHPDENLSFLMNYTAADLPMEELRASLNGVALENELLIVYCMPNEGLRHSKFGYSQLAQICRFALGNNQKPGAYLIEDLALEFAYNVLAKSIKPFSLVPYGLVMLIHHDNVRKTALYQTVRTYLDCDCSPVKAAKALYIDRSTLYYRINQAAEILGMDLEDPDVKFKLQLAFRILDRETEATISQL